MQIRVNGPIMGAHNNQTHCALDFWHKAGYSSSDNVFGKKTEPVCDNKMEEYLEYDEDESQSDDDQGQSSDYKRRIKRQKLRQKKLKGIHCDIFDILRDASRIAAGLELHGARLPDYRDDYHRHRDVNRNGNRSGLSQEVERIEIDQQIVEHGERESIMENVNDTMSEIEVQRVRHMR